MANTYVDYTATAAQQYFAFNFPYLEDEHVVVEIEGVDQTITTNYTIETSPTQRINLSNPTTALAGGELVRIKRRSAPNTNLVDFQNGSVLTESELDRAYLHNRYLAEEATEGADAGLKELEGSTNFNANNKQIKNLADGTLATDAINKGYVDTQIALTDTNLAGFYKSTHTGNGTDNVFTLSFTPQTTDAKAYIVSIDGLVQVPDTDYTIGATAITFNTIPANSAEICVVATAAASVATVNEAQVTSTGSNAPRSLANRFADVINVKDFLCDDGSPVAGDGVHDDTTGIQAAINAAETAGGGVVLVPYSSAGYIISGSLQMKSKVTLTGEAPASNWIAWADALASGNFIKLANNANTPMVTVGSGVDLWAIHNLKFDGNGANQTSYEAVGIHAVHQSIGWQVTHNLIMNTKGYGFLKLGRGVAEILFNSIENGLCMQRCSDIKVIGNNIFSDNTTKTTEFPPFWIGDLSLKNIIEQNMVWHGPQDADLLRKDISSVSGTTVTFASDHGFFEKMPLTITTSETLPEPLASYPNPAQTHTYYVNIIDSTSIRLAKSWLDYEASTWINFTTPGSGTHTLRHGLETTFLLSGAGDTQHNLISGNRVEDGEHHAGVVKGAIKNVFVGNYFGKSNRRGRPNGSGMQLQSEANNNTFTGNVFGRDVYSGDLSKDQYGLYIDSSCFNNSFENNYAENNLIYNINDLSNLDYASKNLYGIREMNLANTSIPFRYGRSQNVAFELTLNSTISNITASTNVDIAFDSETFDTASACTGGVFTAPEAGRYQLNFSLQLSNVDTASSFIIAYINTTNQSYRFYLNANQMVADFDNQTIQGSAIASMALNDTARITLFVSGGANQVDVIGGGGTTNTSFFMGTLLN
jgi:hypothetical protein